MAPSTPGGRPSRLASLKTMEPLRPVDVVKTYPNMDALPELTVEAVLKNVEALYHLEQHALPGEYPRSKIYSSVGPVLVALNPFAPLPCYSPEWRRAFRAEGRAGRIDRAWQTLGPHCYSTVEQVYQDLKAAPRQSVVICGESGAGKTVTNKKMLEYLLTTGSDTPIDLDALANANELLEAFGNSKTMRNDNSSRFGKYSEIHFEGASTRLSGLQVKHYLLERSRVVNVPPGERNYHILHQLAENDGGARNFAYTRGGADAVKSDRSRFDDVEEHRLLRSKMETAGFLREEIDLIFELIKGILYLGNVDFEGDWSASKVAQGSAEALSTASAHLGVDADSLRTALTTQVIKTPEGTVAADVSVDGARSQRDAVSKMLYSRIFDWIVSIINAKLDPVHPGGSEVKTIGLLDIFGFEDMPINGFEQMLINLTNESIQNLFNVVMFEKELKLYREEGVFTAFDKPPDNAACVEMFIGKGGIIKHIAEGVNRPGAHDGEDFVANVLNKNFRSRKNYHPTDPRVFGKAIKAKQAKWQNQTIDVNYRESFQIKHYAGEVIYTVREFLSKSKDALYEHLAAVLSASTKNTPHSPFPGDESTRSRLTVGERFVGQLRELDGALLAGGVLFVRCIKPNPQSIPGLFNPELTREQMVLGGVVSALEMRKGGLPDRMDFDGFLREFHHLEKGQGAGVRERASTSGAKQRCVTIMEQFVGPSSVSDQVKYALGTNKIFTKSGIFTYLRRIAEFRYNHFACVLQWTWREHAGRLLISQVEELRSRLEKARASAEAQGFIQVQLVDQALGHARSDIEAAWNTLQSIQEKRAAPSEKEHLVNQWRGISRDLRHQIDLKACSHKIDVVGQAIKQVQLRKEAAVEKTTAFMTAKKMEANALFARVGEIQATLPHADDEETLAVYKACEVAKDSLLKLCSSDLPALAQAMIKQVDLDVDAPDKNELKPQAEELIRQAKGAVQAVAADVQRLLEKVEHAAQEAAKAVEKARREAEEAAAAAETAARAEAAVVAQAKAAEVAAAALAAAAERKDAAFRSKDEAAPRLIDEVASRPRNGSLSSAKDEAASATQSEAVSTAHAETTRRKSRAMATQMDLQEAMEIADLASRKAVFDHDRGEEEEEEKKPVVVNPKHECRHCHRPFSGWGGICPSCRGIPGGTQLECSKCGVFFQGFRRICDDCDTPNHGRKPQQPSYDSAGTWYKRTKTIKPFLAKPRPSYMRDPKTGKWQTF